MRARLLGCLLPIVVGTAVTACATGDGGPDQRTFERRMIERERLTAEQAACASRIIFESYRPDEIRQIYDHGVTVLSTTNWGAYLRSLGRCVLSEDLAGSSGPSPEPPPTAGAGP